MSINKLEINIRTLLGTCEVLSKDEEQKWRLTHYIKSLDLMIKELEDFDTADKKSIANYQEKILELKTQTNYVEPPQKQKLRSRKDDNSETILKEIKQLNNAKYNKELRKELFDGDDNSGLRRRGANESAENMEKYYENIQEKLGEEMIALTRNLKEQTLAASDIIKKDTEVITRSARLTHQNIGSLEKESKKLDEHTRKACKCWLWIMIFVVVAIFIFMVLFMKLMKKKQ
ncbi:vesicle transport protein USE1 [Chironomus tepperi]|uniref:vesicle transport protein USE1 n=1 Tax=Chironomus tepperi TaxID=113505 RepID=UPI00391F3B49